MPGETVRIQQLRIRVPGLTAEEGRALGAEVARRLHEEIGPGVRAQQLGRVELRIPAPAGTTRSGLAELVVRRIVGALG